jgi:transcription initiation factor TFIIIB Brf1 subunit/transcription initiation factor TFIIB
VPEIGTPVRSLTAALDGNPEKAEMDMIIEEVSETARELIEHSGETLTSKGCAPNSIAATAIYVASKEVPLAPELSQKEVAETCFITPSTIREHYRDIESPGKALAA